MIIQKHLSMLPASLAAALIGAVAVSSAASGQAPQPSTQRQAIARLIRHIPPLRHAPQDRWPILYWGQAPQDPRYFEVFVQRGISPLCISTNIRSAKQFGRILPYLKYLQSHNVPVIILAQGLVQAVFDKRHGGCAHLPPARSDLLNPAFTCAALMYSHPQLQREAQVSRRLAGQLLSAGIVPDAIWIDFESGAYLRNQYDREASVKAAMQEALQCPRCRLRFGAKNYDTLDEYRDTVDQARAYAIRTAFTNPIQALLPGSRLGNFFAYPVRRQPAPKGRYPAYGWTGSGLNVAQPRCYMIPGWGGGGANQNHVDWNIFLYCVRQFSNCARTLNKGEMMVPWVGYLLHHQSARRQAARGAKIASAQAYREMVIHTMLRGAHTMAVFAPDVPMPPEYPDDFDRRELGPMMLNLLDVQQAYDQMLVFNDLLRRGRVMNYQIEGQYNVLDERTAVWSGVATPEQALIRTISFGPPLKKTIEVFGHPIVLPFERNGQFFQVWPNGKVELWVDDDE